MKNIKKKKTIHTLLLITAFSHHILYHKQILYVHLSFHAFLNKAIFNAGRTDASMLPLGVFSCIVARYATDVKSIYMDCPYI